MARLLACLLIAGLAPLHLWSQDAAQAPVPTGPQVQAMAFGDAMYLATAKNTADGFLLGQFVGHLNAGCDDYDTKPIELPRLMEKIQAFLGPL